MKIFNLPELQGKNAFSKAVEARKWECHIVETQTLGRQHMTTRGESEEADTNRDQ